MVVSLMLKELTFRDEYPLYEGPVLTKYKQKAVSLLFLVPIRKRRQNGGIDEKG